MIKEKFKRMFSCHIPTLTWIVLGFLFSYLFFFIYPIFLQTNTMQFPQYVPVVSTTGLDLQQMQNYCHSWLIEKNTPYIGANLYPPFAVLFFSPLLSLSFINSYRVILFLSISLYLITFLLFASSSKNEKHGKLIFLLLLLTGLVSYGFQFELERGQFNLIASCLCFLAVWIFHNKPKIRWISYILFVISVQLKIYPILFVFSFISDWRDWKGNLKRISLLLLSNFLLLFVLGVNVFLDFFNALTSQSISPGVGPGNHSIRQFILYLESLFPNFHSGMVFQILFYILVLLSLIICIFYTIKRNKSGLNPYLILVCGICALLLPPVSVDYTLSILGIPFAVFLSRFISENFENIRTPLTLNISLLLLSYSYSSTLFSYFNKPTPYILFSSFTALISMLLIITVLILADVKRNSFKKNQQLASIEETTSINC